MRIAILAATAALAVASWTAAPALASDQGDALATVHQFGDTFNTGDANKLLAICASDTIIVDDFPPHVWQGATTCADWLSALVAYNKASGISDGKIAFHDPWHVMVTGDRGYVVVPMTYTYQQNGKPVVEDGSIWTLALQKQAAGWRITGWAWGQH